MKNSKRLFILTEAALGALVLLLGIVMILEKNGKSYDKVSVVLENSDDGQWAAFKYGLKMAAEEKRIELSVVTTGTKLSLEEEKRLLEEELDKGAQAVIVQPVPEEGAEEMLKKIRKKVPVMLVETAVSEDGETSALPTTQPDNYSMGKTLAQELLEDYNKSLEGKTLGLLAGNGESEAAVQKKKGFLEGIEGAGGELLWTCSLSPGEEGELELERQPETDFVVAFDDDSLTAAGKACAANNLHGALVYGIGSSTEAVYYLDTGEVKCLVVPDGFNMGYQSLSEVAESIRKFLGEVEEQEISYVVLRKDVLFSKENQEILFTMSQ